MSFLAKIFVDDQERAVLNADYLFYKTKDLYGQPTSQALGGQLDVALESTDHDLPWYDWMLSHDLRKKGHIRFYNRDGLSKLFDFEFWDCYCTGLHESFRSTGNMPMTLQLSLSPGIYRIRDYVFEKSWRISEPFNKNKAVRQGKEDQEPLEPRITGALVNTDVLSSDNDCPNKRYLKNKLGKHCCIEFGYFNGVEIQFHFSGSLKGYNVSVMRMLSFRKYENGRIVAEKHDEPDNPRPGNISIRSKIYSIDMPGYVGTDVNVMSGITALKMIGNFIETATIMSNAGEQIGDPYPVKWHTRLEIRRSSPDGIFEYFEGSIGEGHVELD